MRITLFRAIAVFLPTVVGLSLAGAAASASTTDLGPPTNTAPIIRAGGTGTLVGIRVGRHETYDRTVFDFVGATPGFHIEYRPLVEQARGNVIPLAGGVPLTIVFHEAFAHDLNTGAPTIDPRLVLNANFPTLKQVKLGGDFEGYVSAGMGLNDRVGFRVLTLTGPPRIAVDVAHQPSQPFGTSQFRHANGTSDDASIDGVRAGRHPGYDRLVFDMHDSGFPIITVEYSGSTSTINLTFEAIHRTRADYTGAPTVTFGLPQLRAVSIASGGTGILNAQVSTASRHGFRVMLLQQPTRIVLDVAY